MASRRKQRLSESEWIAFGNRVKRVRRELQDLIRDTQSIANARHVDGLLKTLRSLEKWRSQMDDIVCRQISCSIATRIFYGDEIES